MLFTNIQHESLFVVSLPHRLILSGLRILFLTYQGGMAGSTLSITYLAKGLADRGHEVYAGLRKEMPIWDLIEHPGIKRIPMRIKGKFDFQNWGEIKQIARQYDIDIINSQSSHDRYTSLFAKKLFGLKCKVVHTRRQMPLSMGGPLQLYLYNHWADGIVAVSQQVKDRLADLGIKNSRIEVIHNGTPKEKYQNIDQNLVQQLKVKFNIAPKDFVLGCVSRPKNQIQILKALKRIGTPLKMVFCGIEITPEFEEIISSYSTKHEVYFEGPVNGKDILSYHELFDAEILASTMEGLSQSLLEAMAIGTPVIATAFAGNLDLIQDGENGLLFEDGDTIKIAELIQQMRSNEELRTNLRQKGRYTALEKFNIQNTINNYEKYFERLIAKK